jgi:hypothetical protein
MRGACNPVLILLALLFAATASGQTYEDLKRENQLLKARIAALEAKAPEEGAEKDQAVIVRYDAAAARLFVKMGAKERTLALEPSTHVHDIKGKHVQPAQRGDVLKPGVKINIVEEGGAIAEISVLGGAPHVHDHADDVEGHDHCKKPEDRFDFFRCFKAHHDDDEGDGHAHEGDGHTHESDGHSHDTDGHAHAAGHDRHDSIDGFHFFHPLRTEHAFIERVTVFSLNRTKGAEAGTRKDLNLGYEVFLPLNNRFAINIEGDIESHNPDEGPTVTGHGDLGINLRFIAYNGPHMMLTMGLGIDTPTGDSRRGLGEGHTTLVPGLLNLIDFGRGWVLQSQAAVEIPVAVREDVENTFSYNFALGKTLLWTVQPHEHGSHARGIHDVTPFVELNGATILNGAVYGRTTIDITPGIFMVLGERNEFNFGASFPISGARNFDYQILMSWIRHF